MPELLTQIGVGGLLVILILRELRPILLSKRNSNPPLPETQQEILVKEIKKDVSEIKNLINQLYTWHNVEFPDQPGVKAWYVTPLNNCIKQLSSAVKHLADRLDEIDSKSKN